MLKILDMDIIDCVMHIDDDDDTFYFSMVQVVFDEAEQMFLDLELGIKGEDYSRLREVAHKFKGRSSTLGLKALANQLEKVELLSRDKADITEIAGILEKIPELLEQTKTEVGHLKKR